MKYSDISNYWNTLVHTKMTIIRQASSKRVRCYSTLTHWYVNVYAFLSSIKYSDISIHWNTSVYIKMHVFRHESSKKLDLTQPEHCTTWMYKWRYQVSLRHIINIGNTELFIEMHILSHALRHPSSDRIRCNLDTLKLKCISAAIKYEIFSVSNHSNT